MDGNGLPWFWEKPETAVAQLAVSTLSPAPHRSVVAACARSPSQADAGYASEWDGCPRFCNASPAGDHSSSCEGALMTIHHGDLDDASETWNRHGGDIIG